MPTYRFINPNLVQRDDHVIAWNAAENTPMHPDEVEMWKAAGAPKPEPPNGGPAREGEPVILWPANPPPVGRPAHIASFDGDLIHNSTAHTLDQIKADLAHADDIASLKQQVAALTDAVRSLLETPPATT